MPATRNICRYNHETGKCEWTVWDDTPPPSLSPAIEGVKEIRAVGLTGQPVFSSRKSYERAVKEAGCVVVGNETNGYDIGGQNDR